MPDKRPRDGRDPSGRRDRRRYLDYYYAPSASAFSGNERRRFNPQDYMGRGLTPPQNRAVAWYQDGRYYTRTGFGIQRLGQNRPDWRYYAVHNDRYDL